MASYLSITLASHQSSASLLLLPLLLLLRTPLQCVLSLSSAAADKELEGEISYVCGPDIDPISDIMANLDCAEQLKIILRPSN